MDGTDFLISVTVRTKEAMSKGRSASSYLPRSGHRHESTSPSHAVHLAEPLSKVKVSAVAHAYERVCKQLLRRGPALGLLAQALADEVPELRREGIGLQHGGRAGGRVGGQGGGVVVGVAAAGVVVTPAPAAEAAGR